MGKRPEMGEIILSPVWMIPFSVLNINFELHYLIKAFIIRGMECLEEGEIFRFLFGCPFPVLKIDFELLGKLKRVFDMQPVIRKNNSCSCSISCFEKQF